jgi:DNA-binding NarL/FixJ family response regulator
MSGLPRIAILDAVDDGGAPLSFPGGEVEVVHTGTLDDDSLGRLRPLAVDVIVLDLRGYEPKPGSEAIARVRSFSSARIVVAGDAGNQAMAEAAFAAGTSGYVSRDSSPDALLKSVVGAVRGRVSLGKTATLAILNLTGKPAKSRAKT